MSNIVEFKVIYDRDSDVLYMTMPSSPAEHGVEDESGLVWRYGQNGEPRGCTVLDFAEYWYPSRREELATAIASHLDLPKMQVERVLDRAAGN